MYYVLCVYFDKLLKITLNFNPLGDILLMFQKKVLIVEEFNKKQCFFLTPTD